MIRYVLIAVGMTIALETASATADPNEEPQVVGQQRSLADEMSSAITPTPEMWLYMQRMERHDDPAHAVRMKAEARSAARRNRIAARKWFGLSNQRPVANPIPFLGDYSPSWANDHVYHPSIAR
jgi:hypothetical protein